MTVGVTNAWATGISLAFSATAMQQDCLFFGVSGSQH